MPMVESYVQPDEGAIVNVSAADLIERYRTAAEEWEQPGGHDRWTEAGRALLASMDPAAIDEWLCSPRRYHFHVGPGARSDAFVLRGLVLRGGGGTGMPVGNAWGIPPEADVAQVIRHVWAPLADSAAGVIDCLVERVFAVALVNHPDGDSLAYLYGGDPSDDTVDWAAASMPELVRSALFGAEVCWGDAPKPWRPETLEILGGPLPQPLRRLSGVHASLYFTNLEAGIDPGRLEWYDGWLSSDFEEREEEGALPASMAARFVMFAGWQDGTFCLDLHRLDEHGTPLVVAQDCNDGLRLAGSRFWDWFGEECRLYLTDF